MILDNYKTEDGVNYTRDGWPDLRRGENCWAAGYGLWPCASTPEEAIIAWCDARGNRADASAKRLAREASEACDRWREAQSESDRIHEIRWEATKR